MRDSPIFSFPFNQFFQSNEVILKKYGFPPFHSIKNWYNDINLKVRFKLKVHTHLILMFSNSDNINNK